MWGLTFDHVVICDDFYCQVFDKTSSWQETSWTVTVFSSAAAFASKAGRVEQPKRAGERLPLMSLWLSVMPWADRHVLGQRMVLWLLRFKTKDLIACDVSEDFDSLIVYCNLQDVVRWVFLSSFLLWILQDPFVQAVSLCCCSRNSRGVQAPVGSNPFAPAPPGGTPCGGCGGCGAAGPVPDEAATGPMLTGKGPELQKAWDWKRLKVYGFRKLQKLGGHTRSDGCDLGPRRLANWKSSWWNTCPDQWWMIQLCPFHWF